MNVSTARVRRLLRLLGEAYELSREPEAVHRHLLRGLVDIVGAVAAMRVQVHDYAVGGGYDIRDGTDEGFDDDYRRSVAEYYYHRSGKDPTIARMSELHDALSRDGVTVVRRSELVDDGAWYGSSFVEEVRRPARIDDSIYTAHVFGQERADGVGLFRAWGDKRFSDEDREIVRLFHSEVLSRFALPGEDQSPRLPPLLEGDWSPRVQETLALLLTGASEKQIAARIGISRHTVHDYIKTIYRRLGASSRAEVMARALSAPPKLAAPSQGAAPAVTNGNASPRRRRAR